MLNVFRLDNGVRVLAEHRPDATVTGISVAFAHGSRGEDAHERGWCHVLEHVLMEEPDDDELSCVDQIELLGGEVNAYTSREHMMFHCAVPADAGPAALTRLADACAARITPACFDAQLRVIRQELIQQDATARTRAQDLLFSALFDDPGMARPVRGSVDSLTSLRVELLADFLEARREPEDIVVSVVGSHEPSAIQAALRKSTLGAMQQRGMTRCGTMPARPTRERRILSTSSPDESAYLFVGGPTTGYADRVQAAFEVVVGMVGAGSRSLLYQRLRSELGLAYEVWGATAGCHDAAVWRVWAALSATTVDDVIAEVSSCLVEHLPDSWTDEEIRSSQRRVAGLHLLGCEASRDRAVELGRWAIMVDLGRPKTGACASQYNSYIRPEDYAREITGINPEDVRAAGRIAFQSAVVAVARPR